MNRNLTVKIGEAIDKETIEEARRHAEGSERDDGPQSESIAKPPEPDIQSTAPEPEARLPRLLERAAKRFGYQYLVKLAAHRGDVSRAFSGGPDRMHMVANQTKLILELIDDFRTGEYRRIPWRSLVVASAAALYTVSPADVIPDALLGIGALDDLAVIAVATRIIRKDLREYCLYKGYPVEQYFGRGS